MERQKLHEDREKEKAKSRQKEKQKNNEKDKKRELKEKENERLLKEKQKEIEEKELEKQRNREKELELQYREFEKKKELDKEKREEHLKAKEEIDREKEERDKMKMREKEERDKQREKEKEEKEKLREKEKDERNKREEKNKREREEKERMKQREKEEKYKLKEERDKQRQKEREEQEREKKKLKEKREKEKQKLRDERKRYNERFKLIAKKNNNSKNRSPFNKPQFYSQGNLYQRQAYNSKKLFIRQRRYSHKRIQPKNRIPIVESKKKLGKTSMKIIKPKKYDEDETDMEVSDFDDKLMKFPRFKAKYGKNYILKKNNKNKFIDLTTYISNHSGKNIIDYRRPEAEKKMGETKKTNLTISEVEEEEEKNRKKRKMPLSKVRPKNSKLNMNKKMKEILGKHYKLLVNDPLNPYGTYWPSNFLKVGYDTGFEYENFQSGVPVLKLKSLGKKQLPPLKKKGLHFNNDGNGNGVYSPNKIGTKQPMYPFNSAKKFLHEELGKDDKEKEIKVNKSQTIKSTIDNLNSEKDNKDKIDNTQ